jgi:UDP-N-acetylmuramoylalanine--D-glutamate ligase
MIPTNSFSGQNVAVFGMGLSGLAAACALRAGGAAVSAWDDGEAGRRAASDAGFAVEDLRAADWGRFAALVLSPGVPLTHPEPHWTVQLARAAGVEIIGDTEIFCRERRASSARTKMIAITGTNGKSTTTALTHHLLRAAGANAEIGGNIGRAVLDMPPFVDGLHYVLEYSSFQIDLTPSLDPDVAALLNITPDHLDRHGTLENYARVKSRVFDALPPGGTAVVGVDDGLCERIARDVAARGHRVIQVSATRALDDGVFYRDGALFEVQSGRVASTANLSAIGTLRGSHNGQNAAAAIAIGRSLGIGWDVLAQGLASFPGLPHRLEEVGRLGRVLFINDSKATNADAAARALASFPDIYWIAGGRAKAGGLAGLEHLYPRVRHAYLIGEAAPDFARSLCGLVPITQAGTLDAAVERASNDALRDDTSAEPVVLLSPACASYDQFPNFAARGDAFRAAVASLGGVTLRRAEAA